MLALKWKDGIYDPYLKSKLYCEWLFGEPDFITDYYHFIRSSAK